MNEYLIVSITAFALGFFSGILFSRWFRNFLYKHKLYGIDSEESVRVFLVSIVTIIWFAANAMSLQNGKPVDLSIHAIFGSIVGAYFGTKFIKTATNGKGSK